MFYMIFEDFYRVIYDCLKFFSGLCMILIDQAGILIGYFKFYSIHISRPPRSGLPIFVMPFGAYNFANIFGHVR